jgi:signal peptidase II
MRRLLVVFLVAVVTLTVDQASKAVAERLAFSGPWVVVPGALQVVVAKNTGFVFGLGASWPDSFKTLLFAGGAVGLLAVMTASGRNKPSLDPWAALIVAGLFGNLLDRVARGFVLDWIQVLPAFRWPMAGPAFNLADVYLGAGFLGWSAAALWVGERHATESAKHAGARPPEAR